MKTVGPYSSLCTQVYEIKNGPVPELEYCFYRTYVQEAQGHILEPMCGTGRFLLPLVQEGFFLYGFDKSKQMLELLFSKAKNKDIHPHAWHDDIEHFSVDLRFSLIFIPMGSFNLLVEEKIVLKALQSMYKHLAGGGILLLEIITLCWKVPPKGVWYKSHWQKEDGSFIAVSQFSMPAPENISHSVAKYRHVQHGNTIAIEIEEYVVRMYTVQQFTELLQKVGFTKIQTIKPFDCAKKRTGKEETVIFECIK